MQFPTRPERRPLSLDTHVLTSLITPCGLQINGAELTNERD